MVFRFLSSNRLLIALQPLRLPGLTKHYSQVQVSITMTLLMITLEMFTKRFNNLGFNLTPDREADKEHISLPRQGNVRIEARFSKPLPGHVEINNSRNVIVE